MVVLWSYIPPGNIVYPLPHLAHEAAESWMSPLLPTLSTDFKICFLCFTLQVNPWTETSQETSPPYLRAYSTTFFLSHFLNKGVYPKKNGCKSYSSQYGDFPYFSFLFLLNKDANHILPDNLPRRQVPSHGATTAALPAPALTQAQYWDTHHPGWQGLDKHRPSGRLNTAGWISGN